MTPTGSKNGIRDNLPPSLFMPVDRRDLLDVLHTQDSVADDCEDLGILLTMREMTVPESLRDPLTQLVKGAVGVAEEAAVMMDRLDELVEAAFSGPESENVHKIIDRIEDMEHDCDIVQANFGRAVFAAESEMTAGELWLWLRIGQKVGSLANSAEKVGKRLQLLLHK